MSHRTILGLLLAAMGAAAAAPGCGSTAQPIAPTPLRTPIVVTTGADCEAVMKILPVPLPGPPAGRTDEVYGAAGPGRAQLTSQLLCPDKVTMPGWSVTIDVTR
jgi:hypothetical protein